MDFDITSLLLKEDFLKKICNNIETNRVYEKHMERFAFECSGKKRMSVLMRLDRLKACNKVWNFDYYRKLGFKDFKETYLCKDKFCANCKKVLQAKRLEKFLPVMSAYDKDLWFITFTVPNCTGTKLKETIKQMQKSFSLLIKFLNGNNKRSIDFDKWGYKGCLRSLEVTYKRNANGKVMYHPHFHCAFVLQDFSVSKAYIKNKFSYSRLLDITRLFTNQEVLLQKVWYLLYNNIPVKEGNLKYFTRKIYVNKKLYKSKLVKNEGYSVTIDKFKPGQYQEMFKYMLKDKQTGGNEMPYEVFKIFFEELNRVRQIETYGVFKNFIDYDLNDYDIEKDVLKVAEEFYLYLRKKEVPVFLTETPQVVLENVRDFNNNVIYISRKKLHSYLRILILSEKTRNVNVEYKEPSNKISNDLLEYYNSLGEDLSKIEKRNSIMIWKQLKGFFEEYYL